MFTEGILCILYMCLFVYVCCVFLRIVYPMLHVSLDCPFSSIQHCTMLHLFDDLWLDKIIPKKHDEGRAIYGNLENKINTLYWPVENSIPKNNDRSRL